LARIFAETLEQFKEHRRMIEATMDHWTEADIKRSNAYKSMVTKKRAIHEESKQESTSDALK
jgi:phage pi2 protein 07